MTVHKPTSQYRSCQLPISPFLDRFRVAGSSPASMSEIAIFQQLASQPEVGDVEE